MKKFLLLFLALSPCFSKMVAQCAPQLLNCNEAVQACDLSNNNPQYWNELYWWDNSIGIYDLAETKLDLNLAVKDTCTGSSLSVRCLLFLDLDGDGLFETVVDSDNPPAAGTVNFNNASNPNYTGGTPQVFDERAVPANQKWRFALKTTVLGDSSNFSLQWVNDAAPTIFEQPELAYGTHKVCWIVTDNAGNTKTCEKLFTVKDCKAPTVICLNSLSVNVMPTGMIQLWASDFLQYTEDNVTPTGLIKIGIRKSGTGTGFPVDSNGISVVSVTFTCDELADHAVELWAIDVQGNADYCETSVLIQDNLGYCGDSLFFLQVCATNACGEVSDETIFRFDLQSPFFPPFSYFDLGTCGTLTQVIPLNTNVTISASNDGNPLNGVTTGDMVLIQQFIDGITPFSSPYAWIAADANRDNQVDSLDVLECKKLILGIYTVLPNNTSWRFVDKSYVFPSPNPLSAPFPETITVNTSNLPVVPPEFIGVKICDINCTELVDFYDLTPEHLHLIGTPTPNPTSEGAMLPLQLVSTETVLLEVMDFSGRLLFSSETHLPEGAALLEIPPLAMPEAGVYVWRLSAGEVVKAGKMLRL